MKRNLFGGWLPEPNDPWRKETCIITLRWHLSNSLERNYATTSTSDKEDKYSMLAQKEKIKLAIVLVVAANEQTRLQQEQTTPLAKPLNRPEKRGCRKWTNRGKGKENEQVHMQDDNHEMISISKKSIFFVWDIYVASRLTNCRNAGRESHELKRTWS